MLRIYSKLRTKKLLHIVSHYKNNGNDLILSPNNSLINIQKLNLAQDISSPLNKRIKSSNKRKFLISQECWIVVYGKIKIYLYDIDNKCIYEDILKSGDCSLTLEGGHKFKALDEDTIIQEYKNGPYYGSEKDLKYF